jgi:hypothetical protein
VQYRDRLPRRPAHTQAQSVIRLCWRLMVAPANGCDGSFARLWRPTAATPLQSRSMNGATA